MRHLTVGDFRSAEERYPNYTHVARKTYDCSDISCSSKILPGQVYVRTVAYPDPVRFGPLPEVNMGRRGRMIRVLLHIRCSVSRGDKAIVHTVCTKLGIGESESSDTA